MGVPFYILSWLQDLECSEPPYLSTFGCCPVPPRLIEGRDFEMQKWKRLKLSHPTKWTTGPPLSKRCGPNISIAIHRYPSLKTFLVHPATPWFSQDTSICGKGVIQGDQQIQHRFFQLVGPRSIPNPVIPCDNSDTAEDTQSHATAQSFTWQRGDLTLNSFGANAQGYKTNLFIPSFNQTCLGSEKSSIYLSIKIIFSKKWCWCWYSCQPWLFNIIQTAPLFFGIFRNPGDHRGCGWDHASLKRSSASPYSPSGEPWGRPDAAGASFWMENQWQPMVEPLIQYQLMYVNV